MSPGPDLDDRPLLDREVELLWGRDDYGRTEPPPLAVVPVPGPGTPDRPPAELFAILRDGAAPGAEDRRLVQVRSCLSFLIGPDVGIAATDRGVPAPLTSRDPLPEQLPGLRPERWWQPEEWSALLEGRLGPWAIQLVEDQVVALCHTPRSRAGAAEAGVWTHPEHRRRGHAARVTAAWVRVARRGAAPLFYSARADNLASLRVAGRLGARPIGRIWQLWPADPLSADGRDAQGTSETSIE